MKFMSVLRASVACLAISIITPAAAEDAANKAAGGTEVVSHENYTDITIITLRETLGIFGGAHFVDGLDGSAAIVATPASAIYYPVARRAIYGGVRMRF
jgi:hypothetical protein